MLVNYRMSLSRLAEVQERMGFFNETVIAWHSLDVTATQRVSMVAVTAGMKARLPLRQATAC
jgi:hypothetical protein